MLFLPKFSALRQLGEAVGVGERRDIMVAPIPRLVYDFAEMRPAVTADPDRPKLLAGFRVEHVLMMLVVVSDVQVLGVLVIVTEDVVFTTNADVVGVPPRFHYGVSVQPLQDFQKLLNTDNYPAPTPYLSPKEYPSSTTRHNRPAVNIVPAHEIARVEVLAHYGGMDVQITE